MKLKLTQEQIKEIEQFGANSWYFDSTDLNNQILSKSLSNFTKPRTDIFTSETDKFAIDNKTVNTEGNTGSKLTNSKIDDRDSFVLVTGTSRKILDNMEKSLSLPTAQSLREIPVKLLEENRIIINDYRNRTGQGKISFTHIISYAIIQAVKKYKIINSTYIEQNGNPFLVNRDYINLGIAIDLIKKDGTRSLLVPNIKNCQNDDFNQFLEKYNDIIQRSKSGKITPDDFFGTTVSITNPGMIGTISSSPRLMTGQGSIISVGAIQYPAAFTGLSNEVIASLGISKTCSITNTYDHRIIQGAESGEFLKYINELLLGNFSFYEEIFLSLQIPLRPVIWQKDNSSFGIINSSARDESEKQARVLQLINMFRVRGHLIANLDPLGANPNYHPELDISFYNLTIWDLDRDFFTGGFGGSKVSKLRDILTKLNGIYCNKIGIEYMHIQNHEEKAWIQNNIENTTNQFEFTNKEKLGILSKLIEAEGFEHFIHTNFLGHKRFSLEGSEALIALLDYLFKLGTEESVKEFVIGMAHRGRLNVLVNLMGKPHESVFTEFEDSYDEDSIQGSGDVKYHLGAGGTFNFNGKTLNVSVAPNPSHLEWVNPVVEGIVRAKQFNSADTVRKKVIPILIHGDAAFAGQGVVAETLNLSKLIGYTTGGTIHIIINNQIGFTTIPEDSRSTVYSTDVAKMLQCPIFHVNGDDPEAALFTMNVAFKYRQKYQKDVVIDLFGYRRHGHNEGDEPGFTQPILYEKIKSHKSVLQFYAETLINLKLITLEESLKKSKEYFERMRESLEKIKKEPSKFQTSYKDSLLIENRDEFKFENSASITTKIINEIILESTNMPEDFNVHPKLIKFLEKRREFIRDDAHADWALAEWLAFGSLIKENVSIRLSGQDSVRGTFSQRHSSFIDIKTGTEYFPLDNLSNSVAKFEVFDSSLSEAAVLGFEFGYSTINLRNLVIWEAQFGDFANSAQVIIDNFLTVSKEKWGVASNLVLLLPHGFEGQGPEHSSARLERFLILCAQGNIEVCYPTTPAQYFHLLRRQVFKSEPRPLIIMTPKSLLRLPEAKSYKTEFINSEFKEIIDDELQLNPKRISRLILTSGKVYYDLNKYRHENNKLDSALIRIEQLYPLESSILESIFNKYSNVEDVIWVQEEPKNMGAWKYLKDKIRRRLINKQVLRYVGRPASASPAVGSFKLSQKQQNEILINTFK